MPFADERGGEEDHVALEARESIGRGIHTPGDAARVAQRIYRIAATQQRGIAKPIERDGDRPALHRGRAWNGDDGEIERKGRPS